MARKRKSAPKSQRLALWQMGGILIVAGPLSNILLNIVWPLVPPLTNEQRGQAFGRGLVAVLAVVAGVVMIVVHFVRRRSV